MCYRYALCAWKPYDGDWRVVVSVAGFLCEEPLEGELRRSVRAALAGANGVATVEEEDREQWVVAGSPTGLTW